MEPVESEHMQGLKSASFVKGILTTKTKLPTKLDPPLPKETPSRELLPRLAADKKHTQTMLTRLDTARMINISHVLPCRRDKAPPSVRQTTTHNEGSATEGRLTRTVLPALLTKYP